MTISPDILPMLRCPVGGGPLTLADAKLVEHVNEQIKSGTARDYLDGRVDTLIEAGLVPRPPDRLYPIREGIASLIADEAIRLD